MRKQRYPASLMLLLFLALLLTACGSTGGSSSGTAPDATAAGTAGRRHG
jgi:hypothetical protein